MMPRSNKSCGGRCRSARGTYLHRLIYLRQRPIPMRTDELDFHLPPELIAQEPPAVRHASRLLHYRRADRSIAHRTFSELPSLLRSGDLLVFNDTRVLPARFMLRKPTGGQIEGLFLRENGSG